MLKMFDHIQKMVNMIKKKLEQNLFFFELADGLGMNWSKVFFYIYL